MPGLVTAAGETAVSEVLGHVELALQWERQIINRSTGSWRT